MRWQEWTAGAVLAALLVGMPVAAVARQNSHAAEVIPVELSQWDVRPEIRVKKGTQVRLLLTSRDVTHGFQVGSLVNLEVHPGKPREVLINAVDPGVYEIRCSVTCGLAHGDMKGRIVVED